MIKSSLKNQFNKNLLPLYSILSGTNFWKKYNILLRNQWLPREKLELIQNYKLQRLINHSYHKVPFYNNLFKNLNLKPTDIKKVEDLTLLPAINKEIISENFSELFSVDAKKKDFIISQTSGTTQDNRFKYVESKSSYGWRKAAFYRQYVGYQFDSSLLRYMDPEKFNHHSLKSKILDRSRFLI